jgi:hypothetical protein
MSLPRSFALLAVFALAACTGEKAPDAAATAAAAADSAAKLPGADPDAYRKSQEAYADSVLNRVSTAKQVVEKLGKGYDVGSTRLRDTLALLSSKADCHAQGRKMDPYLAGTVSYYVFMSVVGSNVIRVQESQWTSGAGKAVDLCLNDVAKNWKLDSSFGAPNQYIAQVQFKPAAPPPLPDTTPAKAPAKKQP